MVDFNKMLNERGKTPNIDRIAETIGNLDCFIESAERYLTMNNTAAYQPASYQPTIPVNGPAPVNGYQMPAQAQAMPPAQSDLPWEVTPADAVIANYNAQVAAGIPQSMPQYGPNYNAKHPAGAPQGYQQAAQQAQPVRREVPAGRYVCELADVREGTTKSGMPRISFAWRIVDGEFKNLWIWDNVTLGSPQGYEILGIKLAHIQPGWTHVDTADMYDEARQVRGWATARRYSVSKVSQPNGFFRIYADLIG